jgi:uncharacterized membrane protein
MSVAWELFTTNFRWMGWNLFLAFIPLALSLILFKRPNHIPRNSDRVLPRLAWGFGVLVFILFLPNAAYTTTDIIHLVRNMREPDLSRSGLLFLLIPQYIFFFVAGFQCYVLSLNKLSNYLRQQNLINRVIWFELGINLICAVGVYLGRFNRLNSWNIVTKPRILIHTITDNLDSLHFLIFTLLFFGVTTILYYACKRVNVFILSQNH